MRGSKRDGSKGCSIDLGPALLASASLTVNLFNIFVPVHEVSNMASVQVEKIVYRVPNDSSKKIAGDPIALPPGTSSEDFKEYIKKAIEIVGQENVTIISDKNELTKENYVDPS